jgi:hypothetical protein
MRIQERIFMRGRDEQLRIREESNIFNSVKQRTPKMKKGKKKRPNSIHINQKTKKI